MSTFVIFVSHTRSNGIITLQIIKTIDFKTIVRIIEYWSNVIFRENLPSDFLDLLLFIKKKQ